MYSLALTSAQRRFQVSWLTAAKFFLPDVSKTFFADGEPFVILLSLDAVMANNEKTPLRHPAPVCDRCQATEMRRLHAGLPERLFSLQRFHCSRCKNRQRQFRFGWFIPVRLALATSLIAGLYFLAGSPLLGNRPAAAAGDADSLAQARNAMGGRSPALNR